MKPNIKAIRGSAIVSAIGIGVVLMIIIAGLQTFSSHRIRVTTAEIRNFMALGAAEAGLNYAQSELRHNYSFQTHKIKEPDFTWDTEEGFTPTLKSSPAVTFEAVTKGTYKGKMGAEREFKFRCGKIPCKDDPNTKNIDESQCFYKVESLGKVGETIRRIDAVVQRRFIGREFLMYDGQMCSMIFGMWDANSKNIFGVGHIYGHLGVEIGQLIRSEGTSHAPGTFQELKDIELLKSGKGGIYIYTPTNISFRENKSANRAAFSVNGYQTFTFPGNGGTFGAGGEGQKWGQIPDEMVNKFPPLVPNGGNDQIPHYISDGRTPNNEVVVPDVPFVKYKQQAQSGGLYINDANTPYDMPPGFPPSTKGAGGKDQVKVIDFGNPAIFRDKSTGFSEPGNGYIYCPKSLIIKGNPTKDLIIVAEGNVYIRGDFNQGSDPTKPEDRYGLAQDYKSKPTDATKDDNYDYKSDNANDPGSRLKNDSTRVLHKNITVIAKERVVYDYRNPIDCFENEMYPYMKFEIAKTLMNGPTDLGANTAALVSRAKNDPANAVQCDTTDTEASVTKRIQELFSDTSKYKMFNSGDADLDTFSKKFGDAFKNAPGNKISEQTIEDLTKETMKIMRTKYDGDFNVEAPYKLLNNLKNASVNNFSSGNYLFYPEMTTNGMFISCGKRNAKCYIGPNISRWYDEIGNINSTVGKEHAGTLGFIHRMYGSEIRLANTDVPRITANVYNPPLRRKIYDTSLPRIDPTSSLQKDELSAFIILSWRDSSSTKQEFNDF